MGAPACAPHSASGYRCGELPADPRGFPSERPEEGNFFRSNRVPFPFAYICSQRAPGLARKHIIDLGFVERVYSSDSGDDLTSDLREAAAISIFEAWWTYKLEDPESDQYVSWLEQMRSEYSQLDEDLHEQFNKKKEFIEGKREERKRARNAEFSVPAVDDGFDNPNGPTDGGWDSVDGAGDAGDAGDGWSQAAAMVSNEGGADWDKTTEEAPAWSGPSNSMW